MCLSVNKNIKYLCEKPQNHKIPFAICWVYSQFWLEWGKRYYFTILSTFTCIRLDFFFFMLLLCVACITKKIESWECVSFNHWRSIRFGWEQANYSIESNLHTVLLLNYGSCHKMLIAMEFRYLLWFRRWIDNICWRRNYVFIDFKVCTLQCCFVEKYMADSGLASSF